MSGLPASSYTYSEIGKVSPLMEAIYAELTLVENQFASEKLRNLFQELQMALRHVGKHSQPTFGQKPNSSVQ